MRGIQILIQLVFLAIVIGAWQFATSVMRVSAILLPPPATVAHSLVTLISTGAFLKPLGTTTGEVLLAWTIAAIAGIAAGYGISRSAYWTSVFDPLAAAVNAIPAILFFPLFVLFFGIGTGSKIALGVTISFFPIMLSTLAGFTSVDRTIQTAAKSMGAQRWTMFRYVVLPSAFPAVLAGLRVGLVLAFLSALGGETISSLGGLGHQIASAAEEMDASGMYAYIVIVIALTAVLNAVLSLFENVGSIHEQG